MSYSMVKEYLKSHRVLISYVYDSYGFKFGTVIALGKDKLGWSSVNSEYDTRYQSFQPHQLPIVQKMLSRAKAEGSAINIMDIPAVHKLIRKDLILKVPKFDRNEGLRRAIESAENGDVKVVEAQDGASALEGKLPYNQFMIDALTCILERSHRAKCFQ